MQQSYADMEEPTFKLYERSPWNANFLMLKFYIVKTDSKTVLSLQTCNSLRIIQVLNEVKSQK